MIGMRRGRWALISLMFLWVLPHCGGGTPGTNNDGGAQSVMVVSKRAYQSGTVMEGAQCNNTNFANAGNLDWSQVDSGIVTVLLDAINAGEVDGRSFDWNTAYGAAGTLAGDPLAFINGNEAFLVYEVTFNPDSGVAIVTVELHQGNPYDPNSEPVFTVSGTAIVGEIYDLGNGETVEITTPCSTIYYASQDAARQLIAANFLDKVGPGGTPGSSQPSSGTGGGTSTGN